jgi:hypothetical protein
MPEAAQTQIETFRESIDNILLDKDYIVIDDLNTINTNELKPLSSPAKNHIVYNNLRNSGLSVTQAAKVTGLSRQRGYDLEKKAVKSILAPYTAKAKKAISCALVGEKIGEATPKFSDVMNAAQMVLDRVEPKENININKSLNVNVDISSDEREQIKRELGLI